MLPYTDSIVSRTALRSPPRPERRELPWPDYRAFPSSGAVAFAKELPPGSESSDSLHRLCTLVQQLRRPNEPPACQRDQYASRPCRTCSGGARILP
jgi:hypothetical protein